MKGTGSSFTQIGAFVLLICLISVVRSQSAPYKESEDIEAQDEENDAKLLEDVVLSIKQWQEHRKLKERSSIAHRHRRDEEVVCYGDLGCFRDEGPFNYLDMLPSPPEEVGTKILLYTRKNRESPQLLRYNNISSVIDSNFNVTCPVKFIIHGFGSSCSKVWPREMRLSFLAVEDCNVICVDWANGAVDPNYVRAAVNTRLVGKIIAHFIKMINNDLIYINDRTHLIGFSLGAHVAGFAGSELTNLSRITGLDPAGPLFEGYDGRVRLDKSDANYVDVIHSNGDSLIIGGLGAWEPIGHVDFYPNGGRAQRGCQNLLIGGLYDFIYSYSNSNNNETYRYLCNHRRAYKLFTNSISPKCRFTAFPCDSYEVFETGSCFKCNSQIGECGQLGYYSNQYPGRGSLYLLTRDEEPFCARQYKVNIYFTSTRVPIQTYGRIQLMLIDENGLNETYTLTQDIDDLLSSTGHIEKLIVVHPAIVPVEAQVLYIAYDGWIYSGRHQWSLDKLVLTDSQGNLKSFCRENGQILPSEIPVQLVLRDGDCFTGSLAVSSSLGLDKFTTDAHKIHLPPSVSPGPHSSKPSEIFILKDPHHKNKFNVHPKKPFVRTPTKDVYHVSDVSTSEDEKTGEHKVFKGKHQYSSNAPSWKHPSSSPGSRPPSHPLTLNNGIDVEYGPKLPLPPPPSFLPDRRRPSSFVNTSIASNVTLLALGGPRVNESGLPLVEENKKKPSNSNYLVLHKLPNGGAVNLENLETYSMDDLQNGRVNIESGPKDSVDNIMYELEAPRAVNDFNTDFKDPYVFKEGGRDPKHRGNESSSSLQLHALTKLSEIADITLSGSDTLAQQVSSHGRDLNVQLLPPRLSIVLSNQNRYNSHRNIKGPFQRHRPRGYHRQNKISPLFKMDHFNLGSSHVSSHHGHSVPNSRQGYARRINAYSNSGLNNYQTQIVPNSFQYTYIPLHQGSENKLWWKEELTRNNSRSTVATPIIISTTLSPTVSKSLSTAFFSPTSVSYDPISTTTNTPSSSRSSISHSAPLGPTTALPPDIVYPYTSLSSTPDDGN